MRTRWTLLALCWVGAAALGVCSGAEAGPRHRSGRGSRWDDFNGHSSLNGYAAIKGGGMMLGGDRVSTGGYFGGEIGHCAADRFDIGFSLDWYHRHSRDVELLFETDRGFDPPIRGEITTFESSTDFVPIGVTMRLRIPVGNESVVPFVSGTLAYEILHMEFFERDRMPGPYDALLGDSQTLMGFGWQMAGGVEIALSPQVGLFGEAGVHRSDPSRQLEWDRSPVDVHASLHGGFLRAGLRVSM